ncbi:MAG: Asp-tRNA(Asn)/Glu-tRNA(Gln) amidotransferase GatCAB subunit A [Dehalococcoidia bacterium]|nr:Asp-tRNA(Asn)/Glu-tRNA(Gln) amidotransferase GatCAB subunit A [Dehalococcoidia bacterium]MSQ17401.1 Asp-tRNA(Asn)/Glu-tRNA(Gln) amidotransferase GatCAB subunit A [Dehalococcoidia bacterium]
MDTLELCYLSAAELSRGVRDRKLSPVEIVDAHLARIEATEPVLNSFITLLPEQARAAARRAEAEIQAGRRRGPLHGIPVGLKDLFNTAGVRTTSGSRLLDTFIPKEDCTVAARLQRAGGILLGKLNMHQFAYGPTGENPDYGHMHNPWDPERISGGSSGGSGSAAAAGQCPITLGSDTGGSIRIPAALCGIVGLKPTYGLVSRHGLTPLAWSMDHPGPMTRTVEDAALTLTVIAGHDPKDPASSKAAVPDYMAALTGDIRGLRIGVPKEFWAAPVDAQVAQSVREAIALLAELGAVVSEVSLPLFSASQAISNAILMPEASAYHRDRLLQDGDKLYPPVRLRMEAGLFISAADYLRGQQARRVFNLQARRLLEQVDLLAGPAVPVTAPHLLAPTVDIGGRQVGTTAALTQYSRPYNITGFPAISVPCGFSDAGLPMGLQLAGRPFDELTVLRAAHAYQQATQWHLRRPPV